MREGHRRPWRALQALRRFAYAVFDDDGYVYVRSLFASRRRERVRREIATIRAEILEVRRGNVIKTMLMRANLVAWKRDPHVIIDEKSLAKYVENLRQTEEAYGLNIGVDEP